MVAAGLVQSCNWPTVTPLALPVAKPNTVLPALPAVWFQPQSWLALAHCWKAPHTRWLPLACER